ncbi:high-affinity nickel-transporter [Catenulispora acidiphila DSM 44928]|uniref:High-affinity nickel-transporter n=1 Tax=Catenulispora acidiphila (strain DSM 44928 / JCM 14897 / NBRC 102108 / NRRL B-24433 / ID139908) TaxID=479433 RepID=C7QEU4_CATAD|nr:high-affinity nickel-transporter [Catenulispora acidiphila]ACU72864.1 high-affinity nickel-transporter [Catenulispora acidiphila DSM 44928]
MRRRPYRAAAWIKASCALTFALAAPILAAAPASAHPLGNFTVNHYNGITVRPDRIDDLSVVDSAEIPTLQAQAGRDASPAGVARSCTEVASHVAVTVDGHRVKWVVTSSALIFPPGAAGLPTSRLTCALTTAFTAGKSVAVVDDQDPDRIGWQEITAIGVGVHLTDSTVPTQTISDELRHYPNDLLASPLGVRDASFTIGSGGNAALSAPAGFVVSGAGPASRALEKLNTEVDSLIGVRHLTVGVAALAILLSVVLGASHAALPGHGKTVMAAYMAGRGGGIRDAVIVGATVTATHTSGVIVLGLLLSASAGLAGESLLAVLGVVSGLLIVSIGAGLLRTAWRGRTAHHHGHSHGHSHSHHHDHGGAHDHHPHHHHEHDDDRSSQPDRAPRRAGRRALIGMGVAGGLVPSPSALVVLLGAVALGRTVLGIILVLAYGLGMAATLTAAGLALVMLGHRMRRERHARFATATAWLSRSAPVATAGLVLVVGLGLTARSLAGAA